MKNYKIIYTLMGVIILLILILITKPPKIKTETVEVIKEKIVEVEVEKEVVVEIEKEVIVEVEKEIVIEVEPTYAYNITSVEREMLARLVYLEANTESLECQIAIISVIINRWQSGIWGDSIEDVVYAEHQFSPAKNIKITTPTAQNYEAVDYVLRYGCTLPQYVMYFRANYHHGWGEYQPYKTIDRVCFGYFERDR